MTHIFSFSNHHLTVSDFTLKSLIKGFLTHCEHHDIGAQMYIMTEFKASHDQLTGYWEEKHECSVWIDPSEGFDAIYEALKNV